MGTSTSRQSLKAVPASTGPADSPPAIVAADLGAYNIVKRLADILCSSFLLIVLCPFMLILGLLVRCNSQGPAIFRQRRIGRGGSTFTLYKFRTMLLETPTLSTEEMQRSSTSYCTKIGKVLRRYSLDELPQLWNVLIGDMSMIGPRPALAKQQWLNTQRELRRVQDLRPGITGWAQVSGRDQLTDRNKVARDAEYRERCSLALDCRIALMTIKAVFTGAGAN